MAQDERYIKLYWTKDRPDKIMVQSNHTAFILLLREKARWANVKLPILFYRSQYARQKYMISAIIPLKFCPFRISDMPGHAKMRRVAKPRNQSPQAVRRRLNNRYRSMIKARVAKDEKNAKKENK